MEDKNQLFECSIFTFSEQVLKLKVQYVTFKTLHEGEVTVLYGHENKDFSLVPGKILVQLSESKGKQEQKINDIYTKDYAKIKDTSVRSYYNGPGYAKVKDSCIVICAFPIVQEVAPEFAKEFSYYKNFEKHLEKFGDYAQKLKQAWNL